MYLRAKSCPVAVGLSPSEAEKKNCTGRPSTTEFNFNAILEGRHIASYCCEGSGDQKQVLRGDLGSSGSRQEGSLAFPLALFPSPVPPPVVHHVDRIGVGDFSEEKKSGTKSYKGNKQAQGLKPCRQMTVKVDATGHKESAGKNGNARDLPVEAVVIKPEGAPALKANSEPP